MRRAILDIFLVFGLTAPLLCGQNTRPFEAATIKPDVSRNGVAGGCRGIDSKLAPSDDRNSVPLGRCVITAGRLSHMMAIAFGSPLMRISGFPDWDGPNRFDIQAKVEDPSTATEKQLYDMLQAFLIERFKLSLHRETKEVPAFALVVAKNGPKNLHPSEQEGGSMAPSGARLIFKGYTMRNCRSSFQ
jgi:uncharacterized protein (TIGR03435 family)